MYMPTFTAATEGGDTITAEDGNSYTWTTRQVQTIVTNAHDSGANLYLRYNQGEAHNVSGKYDVILEPGMSVTTNANQAGGFAVNRIQIFSDGAITYGTGFAVKGRA